MFSRKRCRLESWATGFCSTNQDNAPPQHQSNATAIVGATGFEPATSRSRIRFRAPAENHKNPLIHRNSIRQLPVCKRFQTHANSGTKTRKFRSPGMVARKTSAPATGRVGDAIAGTGETGKWYRVRLCWPQGRLPCRSYRPRAAVIEAAPVTEWVSTKFENGDHVFRESCMGRHEFEIRIGQARERRAELDRSVRAFLQHRWGDMSWRIKPR